MKGRIEFTSIGNISGIPLINYIAKSLKKARWEVSFSQICIANTNDYFDEFNIHCLGKYENIKSYRESLRNGFDLKKYLHLLKRLYSLMKNKDQLIIYTDNFQVAYLAIFLRSFFRKSNAKVLYHQFEVINEKKLGKLASFLSRRLKSNINDLNLIVFPEMNRLNSFKSDFSFEGDTFLLPNSTGSKSDLIEVDEKKNKLKILHIGSVGDTNHLLFNFLDIVEKIDDLNLSISFVGYIQEEIKKKILGYKQHEIKLIGQVPHQELCSYYQKSDIGIILYKPSSLNYEYCAPNKLYEYWSYGMAVLAYPLKGLTDLHVSEEMVTFETFQSVESFRNTLLKLQSGINKKNLRDMFVEKYSIENYLNAYTNKIQSL